MSSAEFDMEAQLGPVAEAERYLADPTPAGCALRAGDLFVAHITAGNRKTGR